MPDGTLPTPGWSNGLLALDAMTGAFKAFYQIPAESYRDSDIDVDIGGAPTLFELDGRKVVGIGCKNGSFHVLDADTSRRSCWRQMLPIHRTTANPRRSRPSIRTPDPEQPQGPNPRVANSISNDRPMRRRNFHGTYSTAASASASRRSSSASAATTTTHLLRHRHRHDAVHPRHRLGHLEGRLAARRRRSEELRQGRPPMYKNAGESGISVPAVVNDVVFMSTTHVSLYAFSATDGTMLWSDEFGAQTGGMNGGYGYCMGPAICGNYVVAGGLVHGGDGGILRIYGIKS